MTVSLGGDSGRTERRSGKAGGTKSLRDCAQYSSRFMPVYAANDEIVAKRKSEVPMSAAAKAIAHLRPTFGISMSCGARLVSRRRESVRRRGCTHEGAEKGGGNARQVHLSARKVNREERRARWSDTHDDVVAVRLVETGTRVDALLTEDEGEVAACNREGPEERHLRRVKNVSGSSRLRVRCHNTHVGDPERDRDPDHALRREEALEVSELADGLLEADLGHLAGRELARSRRQGLIGRDRLALAVLFVEKPEVVDRELRLRLAVEGGDLVKDVDGLLVLALGEKELRAVQKLWVSRWRTAEDRRNETHDS